MRISEKLTLTPRNWTQGSWFELPVLYTPLSHAWLPGNHQHLYLVFYNLLHRWHSMLQSHTQQPLITCWHNWLVHFTMSSLFLHSYSRFCTHHSLHMHVYLNADLTCCVAEIIPWISFTCDMFLLLFSHTDRQTFTHYMSSLSTRAFSEKNQLTTVLF